MAEYFDLGRHTRPVTTDSAEAQTWFDRGLNWTYGFNHQEAAACFEKAVAADPTCAMAYWGIAYASGPFLNMPWDFFSPGELERAVAACDKAIRQAQAMSASAVEGALIDALALRCEVGVEAGPETFRAWDRAYADAMRDVHAAFPDDLDVVALFAEALIMRTPWKLWDVRTGDRRPCAALRGWRRGGA